MSPTRSQHGVYQGEVTRLFVQLLPDGRLGGDLSLQTDDGVKVPDVAWMSREYHARHKHESVYQQSPEIVVEIISESNSRATMRKKARLFFSRGTKEFWLVERDGRIRFFTSPTDEVEQSRLCPAFPSQLEPDL